MGRPKKQHQPHIYQRNGRYYADLRAYAKEGGGREALSEPGSTWGTKDDQIAQALYAARLAELEAKRHGRVGAAREERNIGLATLVRDHLLKKEKAGKTSDSHMIDLESRLRAAIDHFGSGRDPRTIAPSDVREWAEALAEGGKRKPGTVRHYLNALSGLYRRAQEGDYVDRGHNPVAALVEKPSGWSGRGEAAFLEVADAALVLEAARVVEVRGSENVGASGNRATGTPGLYPIVATFLLTGGRKSEVLGLEVEDVSFDRGLIHFRPNAHRGLKTRTSVRTVPLWPQLRAILQEWMFDRDTPLISGLLFPAPHGGMVGDLRKSLDSVAELCGMDAGELRTRRFRHTYCSARLQTVQRIVKPGRDPATDPDPYEYVEVSRFSVQKEMGHGGGQLVDRISGHAQRNPYRSEVVEYRAEQHEEQLGERLRTVTAAA